MNFIIFRQNAKNKHEVPIIKGEMRNIQLYMRSTSFLVQFFPNDENVLNFQIEQKTTNYELNFYTLSIVLKAMNGLKPILSIYQFLPIFTLPKVTLPKSNKNRAEGAGG